MKHPSRHTHRRGFTIVELVIVIAVIGILATVLVPTFGDVIQKANQAKDIQTVKNMNTALAVYGATMSDEPVGNALIQDIDDVMDALAQAGFDTAKELTPVCKGHSFYWYKTTNQIVYVNEQKNDFELVYPKDIADFPSEKEADVLANIADEAPDASDEPEVNRKKVDLVMFMGQSNMAGRGVAAQSVVVPEGHGYEFRAISDPTKLYPVVEPFGVNENNSSSGVTETSKTGSMVSAFIVEYYTNRQVPIVAVSCSKGGTGLDFWKPDGAALNDAIARHDAAKTWLEANGYTIENDFMVWCQGETDGGQNKSATVYSAELTAIIEEMVAEAGIDFCAVVRIGNANGNAARHAEIIKAQTELCKSYDKAVLVSAKLAGFGADMMKDEYHYTQPAYNEVGKDAGKNTADYIKTGTEPSMYDPQYNNNYPEDDISIQVEFTFDSVKENGIDLSTIGTVENGTLTVTEQTNSTNGIKLAKPIIISPNESFTIEFVTSGTDGSIILGSGSKTGGFLYFAPTGGGSKVRLRFDNDTKQFDAATTATTIKTHIAVVYDAVTKTLAMYQDGNVLTVEGNMNNFGTIAFNTLCGGYTNTANTYYFRGVMHYFRYVDQALSVDQFHQEA